MTCFKSALIPDFAEHYHLRFMEVVGTYPAGETLALIEGLPPTSRLAGRLVGDRHRTGWDERDFMQLDMRNSLEVLKAITLAKGSKNKKAEPTEWKAWPGYEAAKYRAAQKKIAGWRNYLQKQGGRARG